MLFRSGRENPKIRIFEIWEQGERGLAIEDNGPGIPPEIMEKCFVPFITSKPVGSGLGLSIAQRLAAQNSARIDLTTSKEGTRFTLVLEDVPARKDIPDSRETT